MSARSRRPLDARIGKPPTGLAGRPFRELADPTRALLGIVALGYLPSLLNDRELILLDRAP